MHKRTTVVLFLFSYSVFTALHSAASVPTEKQEQAEQEARFRSAWNDADALQTAKKFAEAEKAYKEILAKFPKSQRSALRVAVCQEKLGRVDDALVSYDTSIDVEPSGYWAEVGHYFVYTKRAAGIGSCGQGAIATGGLLVVDPESEAGGWGDCLISGLVGITRTTHPLPITAECGSADSCKYVKSEVYQKMVRVVLSGEQLTSCGALPQSFDYSKTLDVPLTDTRSKCYTGGYDLVTQP